MKINSLNGRGKKAAGVTVELMLAITLAVVVLFFILNIFGDNLKSMVANSGIQRMYDNEQKTTYSTQKYDPTSVNVQVLAEQGNTFRDLQDAKDQAKGKLDGYRANPPTNPDQVLDLARWATIARIVGGTSILTSSDYATLLSPNGIYIDTQNTLSTKVGVAYLHSPISSGTTVPTSTTNNSVAINKQITYNIPACADNAAQCFYALDNQLPGANAVLVAPYSSY